MKNLATNILIIFDVLISFCRYLFILLLITVTFVTISPLLHPFILLVSAKILPFAIFVRALNFLLHCFSLYKFTLFQYYYLNFIVVMTVIKHLIPL